MTNERQQEPLQDWQRRAWLTEYQALQSDINSSGSSYWTLAAMFVAVSTVLSAGLVGGILSNQKLFHLLSSLGSSELSEILLLCTIVTAVGGTVIAVLCFLRLWLRRVGFLQQINFERMREIESCLGMRKSWRVHGVDKWAGNDFDGILSGDKIRMLKYRNGEWWRDWREGSRYERRSGLFFDWIFGALIFLWIFLILGFWFITSFSLLFSGHWAAPFCVSLVWLSVILVVAVSAVFLAWLIIRRTKA